MAGVFNFTSRDASVPVWQDAEGQDMLTGGAADLSDVPVAGHGFRWLVF